jgi:hypothetical protein
VASSVSCTQVDLSWQASTDAGGSGLAGYEIHRDGVFYRQVGPGVRAFSDRSLQPSDSHGYAVRAVDGAGNGSRLSREAVVELPPCQPGAAGALSLLGAGPASADQFRDEGLAVEDGLAVVVGSTSSAETWLKVLDVTHPTAPRLLGTLRAPGTKGLDIAIRDGYAYATVSVAAPALHVEFLAIDLAAPSAPRVVSRLPLPGQQTAWRNGLDLEGGIAVVAATTAGLQVIDVTSPSSPRIVGSALLPGSPRDVSVVNGFAYVAAFSHLAAVDIRRPSDPVLASSLPWIGSLAVAAQGTRVLLVEARRVILWDITRGGQPAPIGGMPFAAAEATEIRGDTVLLRGSGLTLVDFSLPLTPQVVDTLATPGAGRSLFVAGDQVFTGDERTTLDVIEVLP